MDSSHVTEWERRITALESQNRRLRIAGIIAFVVVASFVVLVQCEWGQPTGVRTDRLVLVDIKDRTRAVLEVDHGEPLLSFYDYRGAKRMEVGLLEDGWPKVSLYRGGESDKRAELYVGPDRSELLLEYGESKGIMSIVHDGTRKVGFEHPTGEPIAIMGNEGDAAPTIVMTDPEGETVFKAPNDKSNGRRR